MSDEHTRRTTGQPRSLDDRMDKEAGLEPAALPAGPSWRAGLPGLTAPGVTVREVIPGDAPSMVAHLSTEEVSRFVSPPPTTVDGYETFIERAHRDRANGQYFCYGIVPDGEAAPTGLLQLRALEAGFGTAEWCGALGSAYWGSGLFVESARLVLDFVFEIVGVQRLEARVAVMNGRGNGALRKIGAVQEGVLRRSFKRHGQLYDQVLWSILAEDWRLQRSPRRGRVH